MKQLIYLFLVISIPIYSQGQITQPKATDMGGAPEFYPSTKAAGDSCGVYYNNYVGLSKTSLLFFEGMRTTTFEARAQLFYAPQPIEISGLSFYAFETNPLVDSLMAIAHLYDYEPLTDSVGTLLAVDTVWVTHQAFSIVLQDIQVNATFDNPVTVTDDYMVAVYTPDDDSLKICVSDFGGGDGALEGVSYIFYSDACCPAFHGWYNALSTYGTGYDGDYLINPKIKYDLNDGFTITDDTICPNVVSAGCVSYSQLPIYGESHYNGYSATQADHILWLWDDGFQNTNLLTACHTYTNSGDFNISLSDTLYRYDNANPYCVSLVTNSINVIPDVVASFTYVQGGTIINFNSTSTNADSLWWEFGDSLSTTSGQTSPTFDYGILDTFNVWLHVYNECSEDSVLVQIVTNDVGFEDYTFDFKMYPNPANNNVTINGLTEGATVELINILGQPILRKQVNSSSLILETDAFSNGSYFIRVSTDNGQVTKKLLIRH
jgi:Secretion system C-terminal sorting domain